MKQTLSGGLTAALLITTLGAAPASYASQVQAADAKPEVPPAQEEVNSDATASVSASGLAPEAAEPTKLGEQATAPTEPPVLPVSPDGVQSVDAVKIGEQKPQSEPSSEREVIARIHPHTLSGRSAATLYIRNIPVLTFLGSSQQLEGDLKLGQVNGSESATGALQDKAISATGTPTFELPTGEPSQPPTEEDPVWRASEIAAQLNQLEAATLTPEAITVSWREEKDATGEARDRYIIQLNGKDLVEVSATAILPDTTRSTEQDALQVTNRLRRLIANAPPLRQVPGKPVPPRAPRISFGPIRMRLSGMASWYGPGFHGNQSASGERFNQHAMTAAHRSLPFGTRVRVINLHNGRSVVVRINDRGPFSPGRVIDLSAGAANVLGIMQSGVAPVRLEVLGAR